MNAPELSPYKVYVDVDAHFSKEGLLMPKAVFWEDGRRYEIDRVTQVGRHASFVAGGMGIRYTCMVHGRPSHLFYEKGKWFVERKVRHDG